MAFGLSSCHTVAGKSRRRIIWSIPLDPWDKGWDFGSSSHKLPAASGHSSCGSRSIRIQHTVTSDPLRCSDLRSLPSYSSIVSSCISTFAFTNPFCSAPKRPRCGSEAWTTWRREGHIIGNKSSQWSVRGVCRHTSEHLSSIFSLIGHVQVGLTLELEADSTRRRGARVP